MYFYDFESDNINNILQPIKPKRYPRGSVFYGDLYYSHPLIAKGHGLCLIDLNGKKYPDASGGSPVVNTGHGVKEAAEAIGRRARNVAYVIGKDFLKTIAALRSHPHVGDVRGKGLLVGVEFVQDIESKKPFPRRRQFAEKLLAKAMDKGLVLWRNTGQADGVNVDLALLAPPYTVGDKDIALIRDKMEDVLSGMDRIF